MNDPVNPFFDVQRSLDRMLRTPALVRTSHRLVIWTWLTMEEILPEKELDEFVQKITIYMSA